MISRPSRLCTPGFTPRALVEPVEQRMVQTEPVVEVLDRQQRTHVILPLGHRDLMGKAYACDGWSMRRTTRTVRA